MKSTRHFRFVLGRLLMGLWLLAVSTFGQEDAREFNFSIPAQSLVKSLRQFTEVTEILTLGQSKSLEGRSAPAINGRYTAAKALEFLLAGGELRYRFTGAAGVAIFSDERPNPPARGLPRAAQEGEAVSLAKFEVISRPVDRGLYLQSRSNGMKSDAPLIDVPHSITMVTRDLISDQAMRGMADVIRYVPGIGIAQGEGNRDAAVLRGSSSSASFYVDGLRDDVDYFRDLYNVERVEALKGPNAMMFGRGGPGGLINRVSKQAERVSVREVKFQIGSWKERRTTLDIGQPATDEIALRLNAVYENSGSYRAGVDLERVGVNPTMRWELGPRTTLKAGYEFFRDHRVNDRGIPSFQGRPLRTAASTFFGDTRWNFSRAEVSAGFATLEQRVGARGMLRSTLGVAGFDKYYQNVVPTRVTADGQNVELIAYSSATGREQAFNQTDLILPFEVGGTKHEVLSGLEVGRQVTNNFRQRGFFNAVSDVATSLVVPVTAASISTPIALRQRDSDITNHGTAYSAAGYVQDQIWLSSRWLIVAGLRVENLAVDFTNDRTRTDVSTHEVMASPRVGLIHRLNSEVSLYASHTLSYIPRAGEKLSSLTLNNRALEPESFENRELGMKWDATPEVSLTLAAYQLDRRHVEAVDSADPARSVLVDGQRARGVEFGFAGAVSKRWSVVGGYAFQTGEIRESQTPLILAGAALSQLPRHTFSMWNRFDLNRKWGGAIGVIYRDEMFAAPENTVTLPSFVRVDAAVFYTVSAKVRAQLNLENVLNRGYASMAYNSNNITPGAPLNLRMSVAVRF